MKNFFTQLFSVFKKAWFWWTVGLLAVIGIVWFLLPLIKFGSVVPFASAALRLTIILVLVIAWAIINIVLARRAKDDEEEPSTDPEAVRRALELLRRNFSDAFKIISQGSWSKQYTKQHAYALPWYLVLGTPQSGRSSLLKHAGLPYPVANESYQQLEQDSSELCQFWFSKSAVFVDSHADLLTQTEEDSVANRSWLELLGLLKKYRRKQPINGVVLCLDLPELLSLNQEQRAERVHLLRTQLQVMNNKLGIQAPIYVVLTKADRLAGFSEYYHDLNDKTLRQPLGFSFELSEGDSVKQFSQCYDDFVASLETQLLERIQLIKSPREAALANNYPAQVAMMKAELQQFFIDVFESNHYQQAHAVRGLYFTSSVQQGVPTDLMEATSAKTYGIETVNEQELKSKKPMFLKGLFEQVIFPEKDVLLFNSLQKKKQTARLYSAYTVTGLIILLFAYLWTNSFMYNKEYLGMVDQSIVDFQSIPANVDEKKSRLMSVLPMLNELREMRSAFDPATDPQAVRWGLYQGNKIDAVAEEIYRQNLAIYFIPYVVEVVINELNNDQAKPNQTYNALRVYLMLGNPDKMNKDFMKNWLQTYWQKKYQAHPSTVAGLMANLNAYLDMTVKPITVDANLVKKARIKLQDTTQAQRDYFELQELAEIAQSAKLHLSSGLNLDFNLIFGKEAAKLSVPALYTFKGYNDLYKTQLSKVLENEGYSNWVLGDYAQKSLSDDGGDEIAEQVRRFYMADYIKQWSRVLERLSVSEFDNLRDAGKVLSLVSGSNSPILSVLETVQTNTELNPKVAGGGAGALAKTGAFLKQNKRLVRAVQPKSVKKVTGKARRFAPKGKKKSGSVSDIERPDERTPVGEHFLPIDTLMQSNGEGEKATRPYDGIQAALKNLSDYIADINNSANPKEKAYQIVMQRIGGEAGENDPITALIEQAKVAPQPVKRWLDTIAGSTWKALLTSAADYIADRYSKELYPEYQELIVDKFPFYAKSKTDMSLANFDLFFAKDGKLDKFFNQYLLPFVDTTQPKYVWKVIDGQTLPIGEKTLQQFQRAIQIREIFFPEEGQTAKFDYTIEVISLNAYLKEADMNLNGALLNYRHGPKRSVLFNWPQSVGTQRYSLALASFTSGAKTFREKGVWGAFRLFNDGSLRSNTKNNDLRLSFTNGSRSVIYNLSTATTKNPFSPELLPKFRMPANLLSEEKN